MAEANESFITSPLDLAKRYAEELVLDGSLDVFDHTPREQEKLADLDYYAEAAGTLKQPHFVTSGRSVLLPVTFEAGEPLSTVQFQSLSFRGELATHSVVRLGRRLGGQSMWAMCLTFDNVTLLPFMDTIPDDQLLHVPALAISLMEKMSA